MGPRQILGARPGLRYRVGEHGDPCAAHLYRTAGIWQRTTLAGDIASDAANVGAPTFAAAADRSRYCAIEQSPTQLVTNPDSTLQSIYVSKPGSPFGPWTLLADYQKPARVRLGADRSGLHTWRAGLVQPVPAGRPDLRRSPGVSADGDQVAPSVETWSYRLSETDAVAAARPASRRAMGTRNGEQDT